MTYPCKARKYHEYKLYKAYTGGQVEICSFCGDKLRVRMTPEGRIVDPGAYRKAHERDFAQPSGASRRVYFECWGTSAVKAETKRLKGLDKKERDRKDMLLEGAAYLEGGEKTYFI